MWEERDFIKEQWELLYILLSQRNHLVNTIQYIKLYSNISINWQDYSYTIEDNSYTDTFLQWMKEYMSAQVNVEERRKGINLLLSSLPDSDITNTLLVEWKKATKELDITSR